MNNAAAMPGDAHAFRLAADQRTARARMSQMQEMLGRGIWRFDFEPAPDTAFHAEGRVRTVPGLSMADVATSEGMTRRTAQHHVGDQLLFNICLSGSSAVSQRGRDIAIGAGDAVLSMGAENASMRFSASRFLSLRLPTAAIADRVSDVHDRVARPVRHDNAALRLLTGYVERLEASRTLETPDLRRLAVTHIHDLVALALRASTDTGALAAGRAVRAARLREIKADIEDNLRREDLSVTLLAARHRLPVRYVRRLFEEEESTFTAFVLERRLAHARAILINPRLAHQKVGWVAAEAGFGNLSYFNQTFRRRFGGSPSDIRAQALRAA